MLDSVCSALSNSIRVAILSVIIKYIVRASVIISVTPIPTRRRKSIPF